MKQLLVALLLLATTSCTITREVDPLPADLKIETLYVQENEAVVMDKFHPTLMSMIRETGMHAKSFNGTWPDDARYMLTYTATWDHDVTPYLELFRAEVRDRGKIIGSAFYSAKGGEANLDKFGTVEKKVGPLVHRMFNYKVEE